MLSLIGPFLLYWLILFVLCYILVEFGQNYLYDEATAMMGVKVALGSAVLAAVLTYTRSSYDTMFTEHLGKTVIQAIVWFAVFVLVFRFHPTHGAAIGIVSMLLVAGIATIGVQSLTGSGGGGARPDTIRTNKPYRAAIGGTPPAVEGKAEAKK